MVVRKVFKSLEKAFFYTAFTTIALVILPGIPPYTSFKSYRITEPRKLEGPLAPIGILDKATKLVDGGIVGAESIVVVNNVLYTGLEDGRVVRIEDTGKEPKISTVAKLGNECGVANPNNEKDCARPLGIRVNSAGDIIVVDAYKGLVSINPKTGKTTQYFDPNEPIEGAVPGFPDDLDVAKDGTMYWSDVCTPKVSEFNVNALTDTSGRLIKYDPKTKNNTVLISGLSMANGVQLSEKEDFVLVNETPRGRTLRYYLKGPKAGTHDVFVDGLPGMPDNLRPNGKGGFYITLFAPPNQLIVSTGTLPQLRKLIFRIQWIALTALRTIDSVRIFSGNLLDSIINYVTNFGPYGPPMAASSPIIVEVDGNGNIISSLHADKSKNEIMFITQLTLGKKYAYMGSYVTDEIWKIPILELPKP